MLDMLDKILTQGILTASHRRQQMQTDLHRVQREYAIE